MKNTMAITNYKSEAERLNRRASVCEKLGMWAQAIATACAFVLLAVILTACAPVFVWCVFTMACGEVVSFLLDEYAQRTRRTAELYRRLHYTTPTARIAR